MTGPGSTVDELFSRKFIHICLAQGYVNLGVLELSGRLILTGAWGCCWTTHLTRAALRLWEEIRSWEVRWHLPVA